MARTLSSFANGKSSARSTGTFGRLELGFGADARVNAPASLAKDIAEAGAADLAEYPPFTGRLKMLKAG